MHGEIPKIAHVLLSLDMGGMENGLVNFLNQASTRFEHIICCLEKKGPMADRLKRPIPIHELRWKGGKSWKLPLQLAALFRKEKCHAVRCMNVTGLLYGYVGARLAGVPVIVYTNGGRVFPENKARLMAEKYMGNRVNQVIAVSDELREYMIKTVGIKEERIMTIENGVDVKRFEVKGTLSKTDLMIKESSLVVGAIGRLTTQKDYPTLLNAFQGVCQDLKDVVLLIVGEGPDRVDLERLTNEYGLGERVRLLGIRQDIPDLMKIFDLFVVSSRWEGFCNVVLEAMASGLPVIATDVGDNHKMVLEGVNGYLVPIGGARVIRDAMLRLLRDGRLREKMGANGKEIVINKFTIERMSMEYEKTFTRLLSMTPQASESVEKNGRG